MSHEAADEPFQKKLQHEQAQPPPPHHLPTPRAFLTDLFGSLPGRTTPATPYDGRDDGAGNRARVAEAAAPSTTSANPLRGLQGNDRNVFLTLHVLFPNELLPALDLLDRRLVTRFIVGDGAQTATIPAAARGGDAGCDEGAAAETIGRPAADDDAGIGGDRDDDVVDPARPASAAAEATASSSQHDSAEHQQGDAEHTTTARTPLTPPPLYYVHSAQQQHRHQFHHHRHRSRYGHHHHGGHGALLGDEDDTVASSTAEPVGAAGNWYEVRLAAWNCSCPAFAFASFPANLAEPSPSPGPGLMMEGAAAGMEEDGKEEAKEEQEKGGVAAGEEEGVGGDGGEGVWERFGFGGLRRGTGETGHVPPVCKHLLACLLVERAPGLFAGSVEEKVVSVEEAAAWAAGWGG